MPHEKVWDSTNRSALPGDEVMPEQHALEIGWRPEQHGGDGWVQVSAQRAIDARVHLAATGSSAEDVRLEVARLLNEVLTAADAHVVGRSGASQPTTDAHARLIDALVPHLGYAVGPRCDQLAITLDRQGVNRAIRILRRARGAAWGEDE